MIDRAVIPAAGLGRRMGPLARVVPKEMFPVGGKPMIQHAVEELAAAGIRKICVVIRAGKEVIRDYLKTARPRGTVLRFVYQRRPLGQGDAILRCRSFIDRRPFALMIPDQFFLGGRSATRQLLARGGGPGVISALVRIPKREVRYFAGTRSYSLERPGGRRVRIRGFAPPPPRGPVVRDFGRTLLPSRILDFLSEAEVGARTGELDYAAALERCGKTLSHHGVFLRGRPVDLGTREGYSRYMPAVLAFMKCGTPSGG